VRVTSAAARAFIEDLGEMTTIHSSLSKSGAALLLVSLGAACGGSDVASSAEVGSSTDES
jgi:hypothetical protein